MNTKWKNRFYLKRSNYHLKVDALGSIFVRGSLCDDVQGFFSQRLGALAVTRDNQIHVGIPNMSKANCKLDPEHELEYWNMLNLESKEIPGP